MKCLDELCDGIEESETLIEEVENRLYNIKKRKLSCDNLYKRSCSNE